MADIDWGSTLGDAASGAASGFGVGGPVGALVGGGIGLLSGLFSGKKQNPHFEDPYAWQRDYASRQLLQSDIGAKTAAAQAGSEMNFARDQVQDVASNPMLAGNAAAQSGIRNKLLRGAEHGAQSAYLQGAQVDSNNMARGAQLAQQNSALAQDQFKMNQSYADRPTFGEQFLKQGLSTLGGYGLSKLMRPGAPNDPNLGSDIADATVSNSSIPQPLPTIAPPNSTPPQAPQIEPRFTPSAPSASAPYNGFPGGEFGSDYSASNMAPDNTDQTDFGSIYNNTFGKKRGATFQSFNPFAQQQ